MENYSNLFLPLFNDLEELDEHPRPLLAHYTSISTLENIMKTNEIWFSNPLYMNDIQEMRFGILEGVRLFEKNKDAILNACGNEDRFNILKDQFYYSFNDFDNNHALDVYAFCLSKHDSAKGC